jgi:phosphotransferase system HPr (HPr) family protein
MAATYSREVEIVNLLGIHARPSSLIVKLADKLMTEDVFIKDASKPDQTFNPRSIMDIMKMASPLGAKLSVFTKNENMHEAVDALVALIASGFGEECRKT